MRDHWDGLLAQDIGELPLEERQRLGHIIRNVYLPHMGEDIASETARWSRLTDPKLRHGTFNAHITYDLLYPVTMHVSVWLQREDLD